jgi:type III restriction enzyme
MTIDLKFDANQQYQLDAIESVVELFAGQEATESEATFPGTTTDGSLPGLVIEGELDFNQSVFGNSLSLSPETLLANLRRVQDRPVPRDDGSVGPSIPEDARRAVVDGEAPLDFSVEMETGTGKTYVYVRTIAKLHRRYGWSKFVIVVPSVAIREGVIASLETLKDHVSEIYDGLTYTSYLYSSARLGGVRSFATSPGLQIMVINIDAFTSAKNIMNRPAEAMGFEKPIDFVRACRPIVIVDEPQNMENGPRKEAIASLSPLFKARYSATHRDLQHLVYRLTPVDAYDKRLVKRIGVLSVTKDEDVNDAYLEVTKINSTGGGVTATARLFKTVAQVTKLTQVHLSMDVDLFDLSGDRSVYRGWCVEDIHLGKDGEPGFVEFSNGRVVREGLGTGSDSDQHQRLMIRQTIESHFEKELQLKLQQRRGVLASSIKPLTLFFIDKVANYHPPEGKFRQWFDQEYEFIRSDARFRTLSMPLVSEVHDGYFATTARGEPKDITFGRDTKDAETAFARIMQNKEKLLSFEEKLRFVFSHSALIEGWDNPNVFTICNLQEGRSQLRKRQQIGRGLRLPVMENGERCHDDDINLVTVIAHEEFSSFAAALQQEIQDETGVSFAGRVSDLKKDKIKLRLNAPALKAPLFQQLWDRISQQTTYELAFKTDGVVAEAVKRINSMEKLEPIKFRIAKTQMAIGAEGVRGKARSVRESVEVEGVRRLPDIVGELSRRVPLSRSTIVRILSEIDNLNEAKVNPAVFIDHAESAINRALYTTVAEDIVYTPTRERWDAALFETAHQDETITKAEFVVGVSKSIADKVVCDSKVEVAFAQFLEHRDDVELFLKLPGWFVIRTPLGNYNPDWAVVSRDGLGGHHYLVRETKGTDKIEDLRWETEGWKIRFGAAHFDAIGVDYGFGHDPQGLIEPA